MKLDNNWIGQMAKWTLSDPAALKMYLDIISKCPDYSVNNQLLLMYQSQERPFTMLKAQDTWERQGVTINQTAGAYSIWEPDKDENGEVIYLENSREPAGYHYKYMYDVNDTNYSYQPVSPTSKQGISVHCINTMPQIPLVGAFPNPPEKEKGKCSCAAA